MVYAANGSSDPTPVDGPIISNNRFVRCLTTPLHDSVGSGGLNCSGSGLFGADTHGFYPHGGYFGESTATGAQTTWSGNHWDDNLALA
jgi:hypothetical protein